MLTYIKTKCFNLSSTSVVSNMRKKIVDEVIDRYGGIPSIVGRFNFKKPMTVYNWRVRGIPASKIADIHIDTGIELSRLKLASSAKHHSENEQLS